MFLKEIELSKPAIIRLLEEDIEGVLNYFEAAAKRRFYIGETNISRKNFLSWVKADLLPYEFEKDKWNKLSFIEYCWLQCIEELRALGVSFEKIKSIKRFSFEMDPSFVLSTFKSIANSYEGKVDKKDEIIEAYNHPKFTADAMATTMKNLQISPFMAHLLEIVSTNANICVAHTQAGVTKFMVWGIAEDEVKEQNDQTIRSLFNDTYICVNLRKIVTTLLSNDRLKHNDDVAIDFLKPKEKKIINEIRERNAKEITIRFNDKSEPTHIDVKRNRISDETINKVARYLKQGNYQTIEFKTRDGQLIKYEETDIIKLD